MSSLIVLRNSDFSWKAPFCWLGPRCKYVRNRQTGDVSIPDTLEVPPGSRAISNEAGRCQELFCIFFKLLNFSFLL
jgi:hypothetical protein